MKKRGKMEIIRCLLILIGALLILDTIVIMFLSNYNLGVILPALLGVPLLAYGIFFNAPWLSGGGAFVKYVLIFAYAAFVSLMLLTIAAQCNAGSDVPKNADAVIVLGAGVRNGVAGETAQRRCNAAMQYAEENGSLLVLTGGQGRDEPIPEGLAMQRYVISEGFPEERTIVEDKSKSTYQNFLFAKQLLDERFPDGWTAVFATSDFHVYRAKLAAREAGMELKGVGSKSKWYMIPNFYLRETLATLRYWLKGTGM